METSPKQNFSSSQPFENPQNTVVWIWVAIGLLALVHVLRSRISNSKKKMLPPGPRGFPIFGSLHLLGKFPNKALHRLAQKYGDIMYMRLGLADTIVVSSPQAAELFLKTHDLNFASRAPHEGGKHISFGHRDVIFSEFSTYWRDMRKMCVLELLNNQKINSFKSTRKEEVTLLIASIQEAAKKHARVPVDLSAKVLAFNIDLTCRMVFGKKYPDDEFDKSGFNSVIKETIQLLAAPNLGDLIPFVAPLDLQGFTKNIKAASKALDSLFEKIIDEHLQSKDDERNKDFVDVMLGFMSAESEYKIERANIKALIMNMLVPSLDSSSTTVDWTISELIRNPHAMKKVQKELEAVVGMERMVEESDLEKLEYLDMVLKESSRLHPAIPLLVPHAAIKDCTVNGYYIPKKSRVIINVWAIGRDPSAWTDAEKFIPERFDGNSVDLRGNHFQLLPFGSGRRRCPGIELALIQVKLAVAQLLHCFDWELPNNMPPHELDMTEVFGLSVPRANNLLAIPSYRLHK